MSFLNPTLLLVGLACVAIPIAIHILLRRRRAPISWGAMRFLQLAYRQQRRRTRLEQALLLATRCLIVACVALAIGKPMLGEASAGLASRPRTLYLLLDDSAASQAAPPSGRPAIEAHKARAMELLGALSPANGDRAAVVTLSAPASALVSPPSSDLVQVRRAIEQVTPTDAPAEPDAALRTVQQLLAEDGASGSQSAGRTSQTVLAIVSDLRVASADLARPLPALGADDAQLLAPSPVQDALENVAIVSLAPARTLVVAGEQDSPDAGALAVRVELRRFGAVGPGVSKVRAWLASDPARASPAPKDGVGEGIVRWQAGQTSAFASTSVAVPEKVGGDLTLVARIDDDAVPADNVQARTLAVQSDLRVAIFAPGGARPEGGAVERFRAADWLALAIAPSQRPAWERLAQGGLGVATFEPSALVGEGSLPAAIRDAGLIILTEPHTLDAQAWRAVARACAGGASVMITPSEALGEQVWLGAMREALGTPWSVAPGVRDLGAMRAGDGQGLRIAPDQPAPPDDLLALVRPELPSLSRAVRVRRAMSMDGVATSGARPLLALEDGSPLLLAERGRPDGQATGAGWVVLWMASPSLAWTDLPAKPLMVPLVQELVRQGVGRSRDASGATMAGAFVRAPQGPIAELAPATLWRGQTATPTRAEGGRFAQPVREAGLWVARTDAGAVASVVAVNAGPVDTTTQDASGVERWLSATGASVQMLEGVARPADGSGDGRVASLPRPRTGPSASLPLWILAGVLAVVELLLARWFSHARVVDEGAVAPGGAPSTGGAPA
jgi:hypothetical protein